MIKLNQLASSFITRFMLGVVGLHLCVGIFVHLYWLSTSNNEVLRLYFDYEGVVVFLLFAAFQFVITIGVYRQFSVQQPLGSAWLYLLLASGCTFVGTVFKHLLAVNTVLNPFFYGTTESAAQMRTLFDHMGTVIGGPIFMILLGAGLYLALRVYKRFGMVPKLKAIDIALIGGAMFYAAIVVFGIVQAVRSHPGAVTPEQALTWPGDYVLSVLLLEAILLRRSVANMGWGYVSKVWGAFVVGILITSFCSMMIWITAYGYLTWMQTSFVWYLWYPASAAFALAPAYQWEAMRTAQDRLSKRVEELGLFDAVNIKP